MQRSGHQQAGCGVTQRVSATALLVRLTTWWWEPALRLHPGGWEGQGAPAGFPSQPEPCPLPPASPFSLPVSLLGLRAPGRLSLEGRPLLTHPDLVKMYLCVSNSVKMQEAKPERL